MLAMLLVLLAQVRARTAAKVVETSLRVFTINKSELIIATLPVQMDNLSMHQSLTCVKNVRLTA